MIRTKEKIVTKALEMFNSKGVEYVGMRELAKALAIRVSNITYYFPTKDDLVSELGLELEKLNNQAFAESNSKSLEDLIEMLRTIFVNHYNYRCLLLSLVHILEQNEIVRTRYSHTQQLRNASVKEILSALNLAGQLKIDDSQDLDFLSSNVSLIIRFWVSEVRISMTSHTVEEQIQYYLSMIARLIRPFTTPAGRKAIDPYL